MRIYNSTITGSLKIKGDIEAENYITKTTVTSMTQSFSSGSTIFGDSTDDTHQFTGSLQVGGNSFFREIGSGHQVYIDSDVGGISQIGTNTYTPLSIRANNNQAIYISQGAQVTINNLIGTAAQMGTLTSTGNIVSTGTNALISGSASSTGSFGRLKSRVQIEGKRLNLGTSDAAGNPPTDSSSTNLNIETYGGAGRITVKRTFYAQATIEGNSVSAQFGSSTNHPVTFFANGSERMRLLTDGNFGIGTTAAEEKLHVVGNIFATGNISGSATSTGSFGMVMIKDSVGSPHKWFGDTYYLRTLSNLRIAGYIYSDGVINLDAGANDIRLGSSSGGANTVHFKTDGSTDGISIVQNHLSGSATSTGSFGHLMTLDSGNGAGGDTISQVHSSYQKRNNHARFYPMIMRDLISGTGFIPIELTQTYGSGVYHVIHGEIEIMVAQTTNPLRIHFKAVHSANNWYRTNIDVISKDGDESIIPIYFANKDDKGYMLIGNAEFNRWSSGTIFIDYLAKTNYDDNFDEMLSVDFSSTLQTNFSDYTINKTHDENYYPTLGRRTAATTSTGYHNIGKFTGTQDMGYAKVRIGYGSVATAIFEVDGAYNRFNGKLLATSGYTTFNNYFTSFRVHDSGSAAYLQVNMVGNQSGNAVVELLETNGSFKLLPFEPTGSAGGGATRLEVPLSRHEPFTIANQDLTLQGGDYADGNISGSATSTGSFGSLVVADAIQGRTEIKGNFVPRGALNSGTNNVVIGDGAYSSGVSGVRNVVIGESASGGGTMTDVDDNVIVGYRAGFKLIDGIYNVYIGSNAGYNNTTANTDVGIGYAALYSEGGDFGGNTAIGHQALTNQSGSAGGRMENTAVGASAGASVTTATRSVFIGVSAGGFTTTGLYNTMIGWRAGYSNTTGGYNTFLGNYAGSSNLTGGQNVAIGNQANYGGTKANKYVAVGYDALYYFGASKVNEESVGIGYFAGKYATGSYNTFVGSQAGKGGTTSAPYSSGESNVAVGYQALDAFTTGYSNVAVGRIALSAVNTGFRNVGIGDGAGQALTTGDENVAVGHNALKSASTTNNQVAIGQNSLHTTQTGTGNTAVGQSTMYQNSSGNNNVAIGYNAGFTGTAKYENVIIGKESGFYATGSYNTFVGASAGKGGTTSAPFSSGQYNTAVGRKALDAFTTGQYNAALGADALGSVTSGQYNVGIGGSAGGAITTAQECIAIGQDSLVASQTGNGIIAIGYQAMFSANHADNAGNVAIGYTALRTNIKGAQNVAIGDEAGRYATGSKNTFVGHRAGRGSDSSPYASGDKNTAFGNDALRGLTTGYQNVAIGHRAGENMTTGYSNTYIGGYRTGYYNQTGHSNVGIGNSAIGADANTYVNELVAVGGAAGALTAGNVGDTDGNVYVGYNAGYSNVSGSGLTFLGFKAGQNATGSYNTYLGYRAGQGTGGAAATTGGENTGIGYEALKAITSGGANVAIGRNAGLALTSGARNVIVGKQAGAAMTIGTNNVVLGVSAMSAADGVERETIAIGYYAGGGVNSDSAIRNVFIGENAGYGGTGALNYSVAIGHQALSSTGTNGLSGTVAVGYQAGKEVTSGTNNVFMGYLAGSSTTSGYSNTMIGFEAGNDNITGYENTFIGQKAGHHGDGTTQQSSQNVYVGSFAGENLDDASRNVAVGRGAMRGAEADGNYAVQNTAVGYGALGAVTDGTYNTCIGTNAGDTIGNGAYNVMLGNNTDVSAQNAQYQYVLGYDIVATAQNQFTFGKASNIVQNEFDTDAAWTRTSDVRKKRNIKNDILGLDFINKLKPVTFQWKPSNEFPKEWNEYSEENNMDLDTTMHGMIAQDVKQALDDVGVDTFGGWKEREDGSQVISREMFVTPLIKAVQELSTENKELKDELNELKIFIKKKLGDE